MPETHTAATARLTAAAAAYAEKVWGPEGHEIIPQFHPADVARIVAEKVLPQVLVAREIAELERDIAELERDIAQLKLAQALATIAQLESGMSM